MLDYNELQNYEDSLPETSSHHSKLRHYNNRNETSHHKTVRTRNQHRLVNTNYENYD